MSTGAAPPRRPLANLRGTIRTGRRPPPRTGPRPAQGSTGKSTTDRRCPECDSTEVREDEGFIVCQSCFCQIGEANIVADVTFEEQSGGRSTVQGGFVSDNARHAKTLGAGAYRKVGGGERNSLAEIESNGRRAITALTTKLGIAENVAQQAISIWALAANLNFSAGRKTDEVVASCLYAACRRQEQNEVMFMDIAELVHIDVFRLGEVYKDLCKEVYLSDLSIGKQYRVELEPLIWKYCRKLQFDEKTKDVATDALKIMKRMKRDWIVPGRHPAGLCGASIILAARMNNFRRSVREVVYVSKVADVTIAKRVEEFRRTKSAALTVDQFREFGNRLKHQHNPPSFHAAKQREKKMEKRKQKRREHLLKTKATLPIEIPDDVSDDSSREDSIVPEEASNSPPRGDSAGPELPREDSMGPESAAQPIPSTSNIEASSNISTSSSSLATALPTPPATQMSRSSDQSEPAIAGPSSSSQTRGNKRKSTMEASESPDPDTQDPSFDRPAKKASNKRQKKGTASKAAESSSQIEDELRFDADGFAIPALPIDPALIDDDDINMKKRRKKSDIPQIDLSQEELMEEERLEHEIETMLDDEEVIDSRNEVEKAKDEERARLLAVQQIQIDAERVQARREAEGVRFGEAPVWNPGDKLSEVDLEREFENDPEVMNCLLGPEEVQVKERIWVVHNEDWLRKQAEKEMLQKIARANNASNRSGRKGKKGKKRGRMGDGTVLTESSTPIETPVDAAKAMLEKRAPLKSMHLDFDALERLYGRASSRRDNNGGSTATSRAQTPASAAAGNADNNEDNQSSVNDAGNDASGGAENDNDEGDETMMNGDAEGTSWDQMDGEGSQADDDDDDAEDDFRRAIGVEEDEFGVIDAGSDGEDYDEYE